MAEEKQKNIENKDRETPTIRPDEASVEGREIIEKKEALEDYDAKELKEAIEKTDIDDSLKIQASGHAQSVKEAPDTERLKKLIDIAAAKGIAYAVHVAQKTGDAYLVDALHDALAQDGLYNKFKL